MAEVTFISNKTRKEVNKCLIVALFAVFFWLIQVSVFSSLVFMDDSFNLLYLSTIYFGLRYGPFYGTLFGIFSSFLQANILFDHLFYFSYPLVGFLSGMLIKSIFSDEIILFILLSLALTFPVEMLNGIQYCIKNECNFFSKYFPVVINASINNLLLSPFYYIFMNYLLSKLKIKQ